MEAFLEVCHRNHLKLRYDKSQFLVHKVEYLGFESGYGWWRPSSSKVAPILEATIKDAKDVSQRVGERVGGAFYATSRAGSKFWRLAQNKAYDAVLDVQLSFHFAWHSSIGAAPKILVFGNFAEFRRLVGPLADLVLEDGIARQLRGRRD